MRSLIITAALRVAAASQAALAASSDFFRQVITLLTTSITLSGAGLVLFRLGGWRQDFQHLKEHVAAECARLREESKANVGRVEDRIGALERSMAAIERSAARLDANVASLLTAIGRLEAQNRMAA